MGDLNANETCLGCGAPVQGGPDEDFYPIEGEEWTCPICRVRHIFVWDPDSDGLTVERI